MSADGAGGIAETGLPEHRQVKQTFDQDHAGEVAECLPSKQAACGTGQELVRESAADTAAIQVDDLTLLAAGEEDATPEAVVALPADQPGPAQRLEGIAEGRQMAVQTPAGSVADTEFFNEGGVAQSAPEQILHRFLMTGELQLGKGGGLLEQVRVVRRRHALLEVGETLPEGEMLRQLHKTNQVAPLTTAVAVEQVLARIDVKRRARFRVQRTQPHELLAGASAAGGPVVLLQELQQRQALFEPFQILLHGRAFLPWSSVGEKPRSSQARMVDDSIFSEPQGPVAFEKGKESWPAERQQAVMENSPALEPRLTAWMVRRKKANRGREQSKLRNQRRSV